MIILSDKAEEGSTYQITGIQFLDEDGQAVIPNADPTWCLCNEAGTELETGTITAGASMDLVLSGSQLYVSSSELGSAKYNTVLGKRVYYVVRTVTISGLVNTTIGTDLPVTQEFIFLIDNLDCIG